jgi:hypothetical protein
MLAGPRGRRLCWIAVDEQSYARTGRYRLHAFHLTPESSLELLQREIVDSDFAALSAATDEIVLLELVADSVGCARYWQDPDDIDQAIGVPDVIEALAPVADAIAQSPAASSWRNNIALIDQAWTDWGEEGTPPPRFNGAREVLRKWRGQTVEAEERMRGRDVGGPWWSPPIWTLSLDEFERQERPLPELRSTTRRLSRLGALELLLQEDAFGTAKALCWPVRPRPEARIFEVRRAEDWVELVDQYPLELTWGRRGSWSMATDLDTRWVIPDWLAVADKYDAVHLTLSGYLATSGRALMLQDGFATFIAGWNPDETYWLNDVIERAGDPVGWEARQHNPPRGWRIAKPETD